MALKATYTCDVCGAERNEVNHWFCCALIVYGSAKQYRHFTFYPWPMGKDNQEAKPFHVCGQVCAHKLLDQFLSGELE